MWNIRESSDLRDAFPVICGVAPQHKHQNETTFNNNIQLLPQQCSLSLSE